MSIEMTVGKMIEKLSKFNKDMPFVIRKVSGEGVIDFIPHDPEEFYPGGRVCLQAFIPYDDSAAEKK